MELWTRLRECVMVQRFFFFRWLNILAPSLFWVHFFILCLLFPSFVIQLILILSSVFILFRCNFIVSPFYFTYFFFHYLQNSNSMKSLIFFFICYKIKFYLLYLTVILKSTKHRIWLNAILTFQNRILSIHQRHIVLVSKSLSSDIWVNPYRCVVWESIMWIF